MRSTRSPAGSPPSQPLRVGELARRLGMTVRTLHHYEALGLVRPARSEAGYRLYGQEDAERLLRVRLLRRLGLGLAEVKACLDRPAGALPVLVRREAARLRQQLQQQRRLLDRLETLADRLESGGASLDELIETMEAFAMFDEHYTPEQLEQIAARGRELGPQRIAEVEAEWPRLIAEVRERMARGAAPTSPEVLALAERWRALVHEFTGGDPAIQRAVNRLYTHEPAVRQKTGIDEPMMEYMSQALAAL